MLQPGNSMRRSFLRLQSSTQLPFPSKLWYKIRSRGSPYSWDSTTFGPFGWTAGFNLTAFTDTASNPANLLEYKP